MAVIKRIFVELYKMGGNAWPIGLLIAIPMYIGRKFDLI